MHSTFAALAHLAAVSDHDPPRRAPTARAHALDLLDDTKALDYSAKHDCTHTRWLVISRTNMSTALAAESFAKLTVLAIQPGTGHRADEKLRSVRVYPYKESR